ncbi:MAG: toprim domain-containing protein [Verrucomicrobia bacterium]|nr:toprim domain-containing protein [Verrucomicrobiota bacterium]
MSLTSYHLAERPEVERIMLTESESDCLALIDAGMECLHPTQGPAVAVLALPGTSCPDSWGRLFGGKEVVLAFDNDKAGRKATERVARILQPYAAKVSAWTWKGVAA